MTPEQITDVIQRLERCEQQLEDYRQYISALRARIDRMESPQLPYGGGSVNTYHVSNGPRRWR